MATEVRGHQSEQGSNTNPKNIMQDHIAMNHRLQWRYPMQLEKLQASGIMCTSEQQAVQSCAKLPSRAHGFKQPRFVVLYAEIGAAHWRKGSVNHTHCCLLQCNIANRLLVMMLWLDVRCCCLTCKHESMKSMVFEPCKNAAENRWMKSTLLNPSWSRWWLDDENILFSISSFRI